MKPNQTIQQNQIYKSTFCGSILNPVVNSKYPRSVKTVTYKKLYNPIRVKPVPIIIQQVSPTIIFPVVQSCRAKVQNGFVFYQNPENKVKTNDLQQDTICTSREVINKKHEISSALNQSTELSNVIELNKSTEIEYKPINHTTQNSLSSAKKQIRQSSNTLMYPVSQKSRFLSKTDRKVSLNRSVNLSNSLNSSMTSSRIRSMSPVILRTYAPKTVLVMSPIPKQLSFTSRSSYFSSLTKPMPQILNLTRMNNFQSKGNQSFIIQRREEDGSVYEGQIQNNLKHGKGKLIFQDGRYYIGEFKQDQIEGLGELFSQEHQLIYEGEWFNNKYNGRGILHNIDLSTNEANNKSIDYTDFNKNNNLWISYEGQFKEGEQDGTGVLKFVNGTQYFGGFQNNLINGAGVYSFNNENKQQVTGCWKDSILEMVLA